MLVDLMTSKVNENISSILFHVEYDKIIQRREQKEEVTKEIQDKTSGETKNKEIDKIHLPPLSIKPFS